MRAVPDALRARLATGVTTLATAWRIARADGVVRGFTDHDGDLTFDGVTFTAGSGFAGEAIDKRLGLAADAAGVLGVLSDAGIAEADLLGGLWDGARVDVWRVDWRTPALRVHVFAGHIGAVRRGPAALVAELRGLQAALDAPVGRIYARFCDADVGDARCGVDLGVGAFRGAGAVLDAVGPRTCLASGLGAFADGWFTRGVLTWADGVRTEVLAHHVSGANVTLELARDARAPGAAFTVTAGCDKRFDTCRAKFANVLNFRGFPHMPGNDAVVAGADPRQPMDGGSRFST